jgi:pyruvate-formate lyase-activating enzyme
MRCWFCAYSDITWADIPDQRDLERLSPREFIDEARAWDYPKVQFFGGEPAIHHEYWTEATEAARQYGIKTSIHTNGYVNPWLAEKIAFSFDEVVFGIKGSASRELYENMTANSKVPLKTLSIVRHINSNVKVALIVSEAFKATPEDDSRLGAYLRKNAASNIEVAVETALQPSLSGDYRERHPPLLASTTELAAYKHLVAVSSRLIQSGLTNVYVLDPRCGLVCWPKQVNSSMKAERVPNDLDHL